jgi:hypothetical protein
MTEGIVQPRSKGINIMYVMNEGMASAVILISWTRLGIHDGRQVKRIMDSIAIDFSHYRK